MLLDLLKTFRLVVLLASLPCSALMAQEPEAGQQDSPVVVEDAPAVVEEAASDESLGLPSVEPKADSEQASALEQITDPGAAVTDAVESEAEANNEEAPAANTAVSGSAEADAKDVDAQAVGTEESVGIDLFQEETPAPAVEAAQVELPALTLRQWITLGDGGTLSGDVSVLGAESATVALRGARVQLLRAGNVVATTASNTDGQFEFTAIEPGVYTLVATDRDCFAVLPVTAVAGDGNGASEPLSVIAVNGISASRRQALLAAITPPTVEASVSVQGASEVEAPEFVAAERSVMGTHRIAMTADGGLAGNVYLPGQPAGSTDMSSMMVRVLRGGSVIGEARIGRSGNFKVYGLTEGPVGIVVFGAQGFAATGIDLVAANAVGGVVGTTGEALVSLQDGAASGLNFEVAPSGELAPLGEESGDEPEIGEGSVPLEIPQAGGPMAGGVPSNGFASGGGGGGGGGIGGVEGLAALGIVAAAIASSDDDNGQFIPVVVSPAVP